MLEYGLLSVLIPAMTGNDFMSLKWKLQGEEALSALARNKWT